MSNRQPVAGATPRTARILVAGLFVVAVAITAVPGFDLFASSSTSEPLTAGQPTSSATDPAAPTFAGDHLGAPREPPARLDALGEGAGAVPDGTTVFDDDLPGVANLDPALLSALRRAATAAADDGITLLVNSGWRSAEYQEHLLRSAVAEYGSAEQAARWVATPTTSEHVSGDAVDLGPTEATEWLSQHGASYGLCRIYRNEPWHYELRPDAIAEGCPPMYADPTQDPRMQTP